MEHLKVLILWMIMALGALPLLAQKDSIAIAPQVSKNDSVKVAKHSPTTAVLLSIIPGGGQIYNKKYWKLPIVYGCLAASGYFVYSSASKMITYRNEYINRRDGNLDLVNSAYADKNDENIIQLKNDYRRNMEIAIGVTAVFYVLNLIDAMVDAHLYYFDISDDLSLRWSPSVVPNLASNRLSYGVGLQFRW